MDTNFPPAFINSRKFNIPQKPMTGFQAQLQNEETGQVIPLIPHNKAKSYFVTFQNILTDLGLNNKDFIHLKSIKLNDVGKNILSENIKNTKRYRDYITGNTFYRDYILKNFNISLVNSGVVGAPMMVDSLHNDLLRKLSEDFISIADIKLEVLRKVNNLLKFELPDFSSLEIDEILSLRKDKLFVRFRNKLAEIDKKIIQNLSQYSPRDINALFMQELTKEMKELSPKGKDLAVSGVLGLAGLIPVYGSVASGASLLKEGKQLYNHKKSWISFIMKHSV